MPTEEFVPGTYTVISDDNANIRREPRIIDGASSNIVGQHTPKVQGKTLKVMLGDEIIFETQVEVYEVIVDKRLMVWGRISAVHQGTGKANWMCIHTGNRMLLRPTPKVQGKTLKVMLGDEIIFETPVK